MSIYALRLIHSLRRKREVKLTPNAWRIFEYLADCANEDAAKANGGQYFAFPREDEGLAALVIGRASWYRGLEQLEYGCGFYLVTRRSATDQRQALYDLHVRPEELTPEAIQARKQVADARLSGASGKGVRKRNTSQNETYLPGITSQNETYPPENYVSKRDVITSQFETQTPQITSQNETYNQNVLGTNQNSEPEGGKKARQRAPRRPEQPKPKKNKIQEPEHPAIVAVRDKHAAMWMAIVEQVFDNTDPFNALVEQYGNDAGFLDLLTGACNAFGGRMSMRLFRDRPREASIAQSKFMKHLRDHDPDYEAAVRAAIEESLSPPKKVKAARASPG